MRGDVAQREREGRECTIVRVSCACVWEVRVARSLS